MKMKTPTLDFVNFHYETNFHDEKAALKGLRQKIDDLLEKYAQSQQENILRDIVVIHNNISGIIREWK